MASTDFNDADKARLRELFSVPYTEHTNNWDKLWERGDFLPWDRGQPNPALVDTLKDKAAILGPPVASDSRRKRALVPGCGKGYDVLLLAACGYDAVGLEVSTNALAACNKFADENWSSYVSHSDAFGSGEFRFVLGDFFKDDWRETLAGFNLIYDYTFLCALPPEARPAWAKRQSELLTPGGHLVCLEFPTTKDPSTGGPPFGLKPETYIAHLTNPGDELPYTSQGEPEPGTYSDEAQSKTTNALALKRIAHWRPDRSHAIGKGTDFVGIWSHR